MKTTCFVGERFTSRPPMCTGSHAGPHSPFASCRPRQMCFAISAFGHGISISYESVMCGVMKSTGCSAAGCWARTAPRVPDAGDATMSAIATTRTAVAGVRSSEARMRPNGLMESALEEQRFEQRREKEERDQAEERSTGGQPQGLHDHEGIDAEHDEAKDGADAPARHDVRLGRELHDGERHDLHGERDRRAGPDGS